MRYFASNTIQYPANKNIRNDACSFSVSVNVDLPFISANLTNKKEIINPMMIQIQGRKNILFDIIELLLKFNK